MATPIGADTVTAISRRHIRPVIVDQIYQSNPLFYRLDRANKKVVKGGTQVEIPLQYARFSSAGWFRGFDVLDTTPQDPIKNAAFDWKQAYVTVTVDSLTVAKNDSPESVVNLIKSYWDMARQEIEEQIGNAMFTGSVTDDKVIDGINQAVDNGTVAATYGGLGNRTTTNGFWQPRAGGLDTTTTTLNLAAMQSVFGAVTDGARHPTVIITTQANYNRYQALNQTVQRFPTQPTGSDEQLAKAGFTNLLYNQVPLVVDSHCNTSRAGVAGDHMYFLNEDYIELDVLSGYDFKLGDFQEPVNQSAMTAKLEWYGNLTFSNVRLQGLMSAIAA